MAKQGGFGLQIKIDVSGTMTAVAHVLDSDLPEQERIIADATGHDSANGHAEYLSTGLRQINEFKMTLAWDATESTHQAILAAYNSDSAVGMSVADPAGTETIAFNAFITKIGRVSEKKGVYKAEVTVQPTGAPTIS